MKPVLSGHSKRRPIIFFKTYYCLMHVKSIAECSKGSILQYFRPPLSCHLLLRPFLSIFEWPLKTGFTVHIWASWRENLIFLCVKNKDTDQPGHQPSLISTFVICSLQPHEISVLIWEQCRLGHPLKCTVSPQPSIFISTKLGHKFRPLVPLYSCSCMAIEYLYTYI